MDLTFTSEQERLRGLTRAFTRDEVRPAAREHDLRADPADCYLMALYARTHELGLRTMKVPRRYGGLGADVLTELLVLEELCIGDVGFGMAVQHSIRGGYALAVATTDEQRERFLTAFLSQPTFRTALAMSEPESGSDTSVGYAGDLRAGPRTTARLDHDGWVLNGQKRWITNGNVADLYLVVARTDSTVPWNRGISVFLVPAGTPGLVPGKVENKLGVRNNLNAEVLLEDAVVPRENLLGEVNQGAAVLRRMGAGARVKTAAKSLGVAIAAYDDLRASLSARIHVDQQLDDALAAMAIEIEATRSLMYRAAWAVDQRANGAITLERMAFVRASDVAERVTALALEHAQPEDLARGTHLEKLLRDAATMLHAGGGKHAVRARIGTELRDMSRLAAV